MSDEGAAGALAAVVTGALREVAGLSQVADGRPIQAGDAAAVLAIGPESDWGHKSGAGAELRFAVTVRCGGEAPGRVRGLVGAIRERVEAIGPELGAWRLVTLVMVRSRAVREDGPAWGGVVDYRARLLRE
jgi:hypothetical protein